MLNNLLSALSAIVWDIDPVIFTLGPISLRYYGVLFALALAGGYMIIRWRYKKEGEDPEGATNLAYALMIAVLVGSRLAHCLLYEPDRYLADPITILYFWQGGLASHGAAAGMILTCILYDKVWRKNPLRVTLDRLAYAIPFAMICVRLGNFFNSEIVGAPCDPNSPLAFIFPRYDMTPRYPSQLFEVGMGVIAGAIMFCVYKYYKAKNRPQPLGLPTGIILTAYFGMRFCVEYLKEYQDGEGLNTLANGHAALTNGQIFSLPFLLVGLTILAVSIFGPWKKQSVFDYNKKFRDQYAQAQNKLESTDTTNESPKDESEINEMVNDVIKAEAAKANDATKAEESVKELKSE